MGWLRNGGLFPKSGGGAPLFSLLSATRAGGGAAGQAVVCPLLRGSSPTRGVAPKQHRGARACFHSGISGWFSLSLNPRARGCRRICRGERWFRPARCYGEIAGGAVANLVLLISGPALTSSITLNARARALLARPWSARCYGVARPREGSRQNSIEQGDC